MQIWLVSKGPGIKASISPVGDYLKNWPSVKVLDSVKDVWNVEVSKLEPKQVWCFFANVFWCNISSKNCFHKHDIYNLIYMINNVRKTVDAYQCQKCRTYFKKKQESQNMCKKALSSFGSYLEISTYQTSHTKSKTSMNGNSFQ